MQINCEQLFTFWSIQLTQSRANLLISIQKQMLLFSDYLSILSSKAKSKFTRHKTKSNKCVSFRLIIKEIKEATQQLNGIK